MNERLLVEEALKEAREWLSGSRPLFSVTGREIIASLIKLIDERDRQIAELRQEINTLLEATAPMWIGMEPE